MIVNNNRLEDTLKSNKFLNYLKKYAYLETLFLLGIFLLIGYLLSPDDICLTKSNVPYLLIILSIITLFHGFESGLFSLGIIAAAMWFFYHSFPYDSFLINLLMVMIFSEFNYYWTKQIKELKTNNDYKSMKLNELANAFYSLKISHDQLEKNYVLKPMSIRSAIEEILSTKTEVVAKEEDYYIDFLALLEKSFHLQGGFIIYSNQDNKDIYLTKENSTICYSSTSPIFTLEDIFEDYIIDKAINYKQAVYISDDNGQPAIRKDITSANFLAAIPIVYNNRILALLVIEKMPFMAFNRENLISLSILFEYLLITALKQELLKEQKELSFIKNPDFRYEFIRTSLLQKKYKISSAVMILKMHSEIQSVKIFEKAQQILRSLDLISSHKHKQSYFILFLFPLNDKSAATGFFNRLLTNLNDERDKEFEQMIFEIQQVHLIEKYIQDDYHG